MQALSAKRKRVLEAILHHQRTGSFPLVRELAAELGLKGQSSLKEMLNALTVDGFLEKQGGGVGKQRRIYQLTLKGQSLFSIQEEQLALRVPILGAIPAGPLQEAAQEAEEFFDASDTLCAKPGDFFLTVKGDSMVGDGIVSGDLALIRPGVDVANGQIAAIQIERGDGSWKSTLKRIYLSENLQWVRLVASNPVYPPIELPSNEVSIVGLYKGLVRVVK